MKITNYLAAMAIGIGAVAATAPTLAQSPCLSGYPRCGPCTNIQRGGEGQWSSCFPCSGPCGWGLVAGVDVDKPLSQPSSESEGTLFNTVTEDAPADYIETQEGQIISLGQVNPMAAIALLQFSRPTRTPLLRLASGEFAFIGGTPTLSTVLVQMETPVDEAAVSTTLRPNEDDRYSVVRWQMESTEEGLRLIIKAMEIDGAETFIRTIYPDIGVEIEPGQPGRISRWFLP